MENKTVKPEMPKEITLGSQTRKVLLKHEDFEELGFEYERLNKHQYIYTKTIGDIKFEIKYSLFGNWVEIWYIMYENIPYNEDRAIYPFRIRNKKELKFLLSGILIYK